MPMYSFTNRYNEFFINIFFQQLQQMSVSSAILFQSVKYSKNQFIYPYSISINNFLDYSLLSLPKIKLIVTNAIFLQLLVYQLKTRFSSEKYHTHKTTFPTAFLQAQKHLMVIRSLCLGSLLWRMLQLVQCSCLPRTKERQTWRMNLMSVWKKTTLLSLGVDVIKATNTRHIRFNRTVLCNRLIGWYHTILVRKVI